MVLFKQISHTDTPPTTAMWVSEFSQEEEEEEQGKEITLGIFLTNLQDPTIISVYFIKVEF